MATDAESFNKDLYDLLKVRGYQPVPLDSKNQRVPASQAADVIQFTFTKDGKDYGKAWVSIDDAQNVIVYYDEEQQESPSSATPGVEYNDSWTGFLKHLKNWSQRRQLSFELSNKDRLGDDMRQRDYYKMKERVSESTLKEEAAPFRKGDRIEVVKGEHAGELGTVLSVDKDYEMVKVTLDKFPNGRASANYDMFKKVPKGKNLEEGKTDQFGYEVKGNKKPWGLYHTRPNKPEKLISKHHNKNAAEAAKWDQLGMGSTTKGEKFTVKKIPEKQEQVSESQEPTEKKRCGKYKNEFDAPLDKKGRFTKDSVKKMFHGKLSPDAENIKEGYYPMGKKASYNDAVPNVKIVLQHNRALEEGEQRYRNIAKIYLENVDGERFLAPTTRPGIARVYARHIAEGGVPNDDRWNHIKSVCEDYNKMAGFARATRNGQFNESAQELVNEGINHYNNLRETLHKLTTHKGYQNYFESYTPNLMEDELDESINELFVQEMVDPRIESAMPILSRLKKPVTEMEEVDTLAEWADSIINEKLDLEDSVEENFIGMAPQAVAEEELGEISKGKAQKYINRARPSLDDLRWKSYGNHHGPEDGWDDENELDADAIKAGEKHDKREKMIALARAKRNKSGETAPHYTPQAKARVKATDSKVDEDLDEGLAGDFMHSLTSPVRDLTRKGGAKKALRKVVPGLGKHEAGERAKDEKFHASLMKTSSPEFNPDHDKDVRSGKASEKSAKRFSNIAQGKKPFDEGLGDAVKKGVEEAREMSPALKAAQKNLAGLASGEVQRQEKQRKAAEKAQRQSSQYLDRVLNRKPAKKSKQDLQTLWAKIESVIANSFPDGDPYDQLWPYMQKNGFTQDDVERASKMNGYDDLWDYWNTLTQDIENDAYYDWQAAKRPEAPANPLSKDAADIQHRDWVSKKNPQVRARGQFMEEELDEDLGPEQKRVGQLGPTEKVKNNNIGKLVGANESTEIDPELARIIEMARFKR
jgi:hypothetical protein